MLVNDSVCTVSIAVVLLSLAGIFYKKYFYSYWKRQNIPCLHKEFIKLNQHSGIKYKKIYQIIKNNKLKHAGIYHQLRPVYIIQDLNILKSIMITDFQYFPDRGLYFNKQSDPLSSHIFNLSGLEWKQLRNQLNQIFTPAKLKTLFPLFLNCEKKFSKQLQVTQGLDIKEIIDNFISNIIETSVFGLEFQSVSPLQKFCREIFQRSKTRKLKGFIVDNFPNFGKLLQIALIPKTASDCFLQVIQDVLKYRQTQNIQYHDFLGFLTKLKLENGCFLKTEQIAAQCFIFFLAGMSTSPSAITFALYEIARNLNIQNKLRMEIRTVLQDEITYEALQDLKYLEQTINETFRKYPPAAYLNRQCCQDYPIPGTPTILKSGTMVVIPVLGLHYDPDFYPNPEKFDPGRFTITEIQTRPKFTFIPFGEGPRICLGLRFGLIQTKLALISILKNYQITVNSRTEEPLEMKPETLVLTPKTKIWLNFNKI